MAVPAYQTYISEFIGTFLLVFTVGCNVLTGASANWAATSIACVLMVAIYALGGVSGAHFNPAVSFACGVAGKAEWGQVASYTVVQILAGIFAGICYHAAFAGHGEAPFALGPKEGFGWLEVMVVEVLYTCMLCFVVLNVATTKAAEGCEFFGISIGFVIIAGGYAAGGVSGGAFNPAVAFGIDISGSSHFGWSFYYWMYELIGAALAATLFKVVRPDEYGAQYPYGYPPSVKLLSEFIGTFYLCLTVGLCVLGKSPATPWSAAAALMSMIFALGSVSGAHFNPAVTFALILRKAIPAGEAATYMIVQLFGSIAASLACMVVQHGATYGFGPGTPPKGYGWGGVAAAEITFTFVLCFVVLCVCTWEPTKLKHFYGLAIGSCVTAGGFAIGAVSGGALNPAVALGATIVDLYHEGSLVNGLAFAALELLGGALAVGAFVATHSQPEKL